MAEEMAERARVMERQVAEMVVDVVAANQREAIPVRFLVRWMHVRIIAGAILLVR